MKKTTASEKVIKRIKSAVEFGGVRIAFIAKETGISYYRIASVVNTASYRYATTFSDKEVSSITKTMNAIEKAVK